MMHFFELALMFGGLAAAGAVGFVCALGLVVWVAGGRAKPLKKE